MIDFFANLILFDDLTDADFFTTVKFKYKLNKNSSSYENFPDIFEKRSYENQYWINIVFEILLDIKLINMITPNKPPLSYYVTSIVLLYMTLQHKKTIFPHFLLRHHDRNF
ncbi:hypothetical protein BpHYR1_006655 [Brachionus plicatilis]|uniref:Uncharacterized protein n=1 Tax=Brachionus plicatilis TaxID=10195 RepID=A0A3M7R1Q9_BRAPC|nr:hypothetical protein BpHYR1_006655 [Brachionus plicatilis]